MRDYILWIFISFLLSHYKFSDGSCTFPSEIDGVWVSAHKGSLTFNNTHLTGYPIYMSHAVQSLDFECYEQSDRKYLLRATETALVFGQNIRGYLCIQLWRVSATKYYYYIGTAISATNNDYIRGQNDRLSITMEEVCNVPEPYATGAFIMLVKDGEVSLGSAEASCPTAMLANFAALTITDSSGATTCSGSSVNVCNDNTEMNYTIDASCASALKFSSGGYWVCLHSIEDGTTTYMTAWNNDTTVDGTSTYRFVCYALTTSSTSDTTYATVHPEYCKDSTQTSTSVPSPGTVHVYSSPTLTCYDVVESGSSAVYYATIALGAMFLISLVILIICLYKKGCCRAIKRKCQKRPTSATSSVESTVEQGEQVNRPIFKTSAKKLKPIAGFKAKRPLRVGPIVEPSLEPLPKVEPLYAILDPIKKRKTSAHSRRSSIGSLFKFDSYLRAHNVEVTYPPLQH